MIRIIGKRILFGTVVQEGVTEKVFNGPRLSAVGVVLSRPTPLPVCNYLPEKKNKKKSLREKHKACAHCDFRNLIFITRYHLI